MSLLRNLVLFVLGLVLPAAAAEFRWSERLAPGQTLEIKGVSGDIRAVAAPGDQAQVVARKHARRSDPAAVEIRVVPHAGGVTICALYPGGSWRRPNECVPGSGGRMETQDNDVSVDFEVQVPAGVRFVGRTVNGEVEGRDLPGDAEAASVNGDVEVAAAGLVRARSVNGSVRVELGKTNWEGELSFETVNGSLTVTLPDTASTEVKARTVNGDIRTDFPLAVRGGLVGHKLEGTLGSGGRSLSLETVNGSVHLRKVR
ncbi:MAG TPA: DUF4097 family beta strand repeat-containing protein [Vicinamibacteria bacterium]|nr:DUF4097 family beta strand repeat-containing protein [Vicinamibacteria bacterium]